MNKKQDTHSVSSSCSSLISSLNTRLPVVTLIIIFSLFLVLFAAGGVHAASSSVVMEETNPVITDLTPTSTPA